MKEENKKAEERWEERAERVAEWIWQLSPHNRWKAKKEIKSFIEEIILDTTKNVREELIKEINDLIIEEMIICYRYQENQSTSRLTSLAVKIKSIK